jgi:hypothetical protein
MKIKDAFQAYDDRLKLDPGERLRAEMFHNELTVRLKDRGVISGSFLQGSLARKTMLKPLRDIDKVVILSAVLSYLRDDPNGAKVAVEVIEEALLALYPQVNLERSRHAIQMDLGPDSFSFDVVPAFEVGDDSGDVLIMDLKSGGWKRSNTRALILAVADRNKETNGAFIHQVRQIKHWARNTLEGVLPGLHVESIAFECITQELEHDAAALAILTCGCDLLATRYFDPTGLDELSSKLTDSERTASLRAFSAAREVAQLATELAVKGRLDEALAQWRGLFGDPFPSTAASERGFLTGSASGLGAAVSAAHRAPATTPTRAWAPR